MSKYEKLHSLTKSLILKLNFDINAEPGWTIFKINLMLLYVSKIKILWYIFLWAFDIMIDDCNYTIAQY